MMENIKKYKYFSLFTGIGGFELGIEQAYEILYNQSKNARFSNEEDISSANGLNVERTTCVGFSEIDKYAEQIYKRHYPKHKNYGDITKINEKDLPNFDILVGGFPCQSFSIAGKRRGFDDTRGTLFFDIARILKEKRPRLLLLENVKGLLSHDDGNTFKTIVATLTELGYDLQWQVLNSKNHGVPQNRERIFIIGHLAGTTRPEVFPLTGTNPKTIKYYQGDVSGKGYGSQQDRVFDTRGIMGTLPSSRTEDKIKIFEPRIIQRPRGKNMGGVHKISPTVSANAFQENNHIAIPVLTPDRVEKRQAGRRMKENGEPSFTVTPQDKHGVYDGIRVRRLTPMECERLQGFPDNWTEFGTECMGSDETVKYCKSHLIRISDTQRYKTLGNAVTVNVIKDICLKLLKTT